MGLDFSNEKDVQKAYQWAKERVDNFYLSSEYNNAWSRYQARINAHYQRHDNNAAAWRSKLYFASFRTANIALDAQFRAAHASDPFIHVSSVDNSTPDEEAAVKAQLMHFDLNYDLKASSFKSKLFQMYWYTEVFGTAVGREYIRSKQEVVKTRSRKVDPLGIDQGIQTEESIKRKEYTATDVIHPLNFAHDITKKSFLESEWASVRFELPIEVLYTFLGNDGYHQEGVKKTIEATQKGDGIGFVVGQSSIYSERGNDDIGQRRHMITVDEYSGPIRCKGNEGDNTLYYMLYVKSINQVLAIKKSPFTQHPYWKMATYQPPDGPYGIGPNDAILPINLWENNTINQYNDWSNSALKYMFEAQPENVVGGLSTIINGLPGGIIPLDKDVSVGSTMRGLGQNNNTMPPVGDIINLIEQAKQQYGASSNLRGRDSGSNADTATGITLLAQREDDSIQAMQDDIDMGIQNAMHIKVKHSQDFFNEERVAELHENGDVHLVPHYPYELSGVDYAFDIKREVGDIRAGKAMSFMKLLSSLDQQLMAKNGPQGGLPPKLLIDSVKEVGTSLGVSGIDEITKEIEMSATKPINAGAGQPPMPGQAPQMPQMPQMPSQVEQGGIDAALA